MACRWAVAHRLVDEELVDLLLAGGGKLGGLEHRGGPLARTVGHLRALRPRRRPPQVPRRHHHHHRLPSRLRHLNESRTAHLTSSKKIKNQRNSWPSRSNWGRSVRAVPAWRGSAA
uniref:Uncharacterized protein n=1 Tax=Oryza brachyantha TaxID=4533 RepID=J3N3X2_ORYBR